MRSIPLGRLLPVAAVVLITAVGCAPAATQEQGQLTQALDELSANIDELTGQVSALHDDAHGLEGRLEELEGTSGQLLLDVGRVGPGRAQFLPDPPAGMVTVQFVVEDENAAIPGAFTFHLAPEGAELFETLSLEAGEELVTGPLIKDGIAFVDPGIFYRLQVVYQNPSAEEVNFLIRGGIMDPQLALPYMRNRCWCAAVPFSAPAGGTFSRIIDVGAASDTPPGAKAIVIFPAARLTE